MWNNMKQRVVAIIKRDAQHECRAYFGRQSQVTQPNLPA